MLNEILRADDRRGVGVEAVGAFEPSLMRKIGSRPWWR
jgi:hypothetical protein